MSLASSGFKPIILERGQPVEARGKSIGALIHRRSIDPESNFSFGEGGAGTWSDGKLTTRIGRNSEPVRFVLETLVKYGAPPRILVEGSPHLGTDNLVRLLRNMRADIQSLGGEFHFECRASKFHIKDRKISSLDAENNNDKASHNANHSVSFNDLDAGAVVLATGHSARDVYEELAASGVQLEAKGFAVGFRIEHPQRIINEIQYGEGKMKHWTLQLLTTISLSLTIYIENENTHVEWGNMVVSMYLNDKSYTCGCFLTIKLFFSHQSAPIDYQQMTPTKGISIAFENL